VRFLRSEETRNRRCAPRTLRDPSERCRSATVSTARGRFFHLAHRICHTEAQKADEGSERQPRNKAARKNLFTPTEKDGIKKNCIARAHEIREERKRPARNDSRGEVFVAPGYKRPRRCIAPNPRPPTPRRDVARGIKNRFFRRREARTVSIFPRDDNDDANTSKRARKAWNNEKYRRRRRALPLLPMVTLLSRQREKTARHLPPADENKRGEEKKKSCLSFVGWRRTRSPSRIFW